MLLHGYAVGMRAACLSASRISGPIFWRKPLLSPNYPIKAERSCTFTGGSFNSLFIHMSVGDVTVDDDDTKEKGFYTHSARGEERICHPLNAAESSPIYTFLGSIISLSLIINNPLRHTDVADSTTARSSWKTTNLRLNSGAMENFTSSTIVFQVSFLQTQYSLLAVAVTHPSDSYVIHAGSKP